MSIADNGPGVSDDMKTHIFDMFYSGNNKVADSRRSLGLDVYKRQAISVGNLPLHGTKLLVIIAIKRSLGDSIIRHPMTPHALQPCLLYTSRCV